MPKKQHQWEVIRFKPSPAANGRLDT